MRKDVQYVIRVEWEYILVARVVQLNEQHHIDLRNEKGKIYVKHAFYYDPLLNK